MKTTVTILLFAATLSAFAPNGFAQGESEKCIKASETARTKEIDHAVGKAADKERREAVRKEREACDKPKKD